MSVEQLDLPTTFSSYKFVIVYGTTSRESGSNLVEIPFTGFNVLGSNVDLTSIQYSLDNSSFSDATPNNPSAIENLTFSTDGIGNVFVWKAYDDLGSSLFNRTIWFRMKANDGTYSTPFALTSFVISKSTTSPETRNVQVFPENYKGVSGSDLAGILKPITR